jgi:hypothetical protein
MKKHIICIALSIIFIYTLYTYTINYPIFLNKKAVETFFKEDPDYYFRNLTPIELFSMGYRDKDIKKNINNYVNDSIKCIEEWNDEEKSLITKHCIEADTFLKNFKLDSFPNVLVSKIKWKFAKIRGQIYEGAHPHTRNDIIFLPVDIINPDVLTKYLVHEKCHVFSRLYPAHMSVWIKANGYKIYKKLDEYPLRRNNPDVDGWVYIDPYGRETLAQFIKENPDRFEDVIYPGGMHSHETEHPNETLAYIVDSYVK